MKNLIKKLLLRSLNSSWVNGTPCPYGHINQIDAFGYDNLVAEDKQQPGITVKEVLASADAFKSCPITKHGLSVIEDGEVREGTIWDVHELRQSLTRVAAPGREKEGRDGMD